MKGAIYYVAIATVIFSHAKITCYFHNWRYHISVYIINCNNKCMIMVHFIRVIWVCRRFTLAWTQSVLYFLLVSTTKEKDRDKFKNSMIENNAVRRTMLWTGMPFLPVKENLDFSHLRQCSSQRWPTQSLFDILYFFRGKHFFLPLFWCCKFWQTIAYVFL